MAKKKQENKISEKHLSEIQAFIKKAQSLQIEIGSLEFKKSNLLDQLNSVDDKLISIQKEITAEYGDINLNVTDGTYVKS